MSTFGPCKCAYNGVEAVCKDCPRFEQVKRKKANMIKVTMPTEVYDSLLNVMTALNGNYSEQEVQRCLGVCQHYFNKWNDELVENNESVVIERA